MCAISISINHCGFGNSNWDGFVNQFQIKSKRIFCGLYVHSLNLMWRIQTTVYFSSISATRKYFKCFSSNSSSSAKLMLNFWIFNNEFKLPGTNGIMKWNFNWKQPTAASFIVQHVISSLEPQTSSITLKRCECIAKLKIFKKCTNISWFSSAALI